MSLTDNTRHEYAPGGTKEYPQLLIDHVAKLSVSEEKIDKPISTTIQLKECWSVSEDTITTNRSRHTHAETLGGAWLLGVRLPLSD